MLASVAHTSFSFASSNKAPNRMPANGQKIDTQGSGVPPIFEWQIASLKGAKI